MCSLLLWRRPVISHSAKLRPYISKKDIAFYVIYYRIPSSVNIFSHLCSPAEIIHTISEKISIRPSTIKLNLAKSQYMVLVEVDKSFFNDKTFEVIRGQVQDHGPVKVAKMVDFEVDLLRYLLRYPEYY